MPALRVVYDAISQFRSSVVLSTILVAPVFAPLLALSGMEDRLFTFWQRLLDTGFTCHIAERHSGAFVLVGLCS
jgi:hypothetical protein